MPKLMHIEFFDERLWVKILPRNNNFGFIYQLVSPSGKIYIGQTRLDVEKRWLDYKRLHCKSQTKLFNALKKYGPENFKYIVIDRAKDQQELNEKEMYYINLLGTTKSKYGYNVSSGGSNIFMTAETRRRIGIAGTKRKHTKESKEKMSRIRRGEKRKPHTESWKRALSERLRGKGNHFFGVPFFLGKKHSEIAKIKISEKNSRIYKLQNPQGDVITIKNLKEFCKKNSLNNSLMVAVSKGRRKTHKGWRAEKITFKGGTV